VTKRQSDIDREVMPESPVFEVTSPAKRKNKKYLWIAGVILLLGLWWYKTNTWPVVAMVGFTPVFRHQVNQALFKQGGKNVVEGIVTERLVKGELAKKGISVSDSQADAKIEEVKKSLGEGVDFDALLAEKGLTVDEVRSQVKIQLGLEQIIASQATVSAEEVDKYVKDNGAFLNGTTDAEKRASAEKMLADQKVQTGISTWIEELKTRSKVWYIGINQ